MSVTDRELRLCTEVYVPIPVNLNNSQYLEIKKTECTSSLSWHPLTEVSVLVAKSWIQIMLFPHGGTEKENTEIENEVALLCAP